MPRAVHVALMALVVLLSACAGAADDSGDTAHDSAGAAAEATAPGAAGPTSDRDGSAPTDGAAPSPDGAAGQATVATGATDDLGPLLTDGDGRTLYVFFEDRGGRSACTGACADNWPPLSTDAAPAAADGVDPALVGTIARDDGTTQVTYDGQPLYRYRADDAPGDVAGFGIGNVWYPVAPDGTPLDLAEQPRDDDGY